MTGAAMTTLPGYELARLFAQALRRFSRLVVPRYVPGQRSSDAHRRDESCRRTKGWPSSGSVSQRATAETGTKALSLGSGSAATSIFHTKLDTSVDRVAIVGSPCPSRSPGCVLRGMGEVGIGRGGPRQVAGDGGEEQVVGAVGGAEKDPVLPADNDRLGRQRLAGFWCQISGYFSTAERVDTEGQ
jgi:hypothetical protein